MEKRELEILMKAVAAGRVPPQVAADQVRQLPYTDIGYAKVDNERGIRQGVSEVIYGAGKTVDQMKGICESMQSSGQGRILITRLDEKKAELLKGSFALDYYPQAQIALIGGMPEPDGNGVICIAVAGTSDLPVAEEAALTAEALGNKVNRLYDVGVSGIHRLLSHSDDIMNAQVVIAVAGMEGALASVVAGIASCPVLAVPTSVGYGASFGGLSALLSMLNSCASGVSVLNIDNGFGAGYQASMINHLKG